MHRVRKSVLIKAGLEEVYCVARDCMRWNELYENMSAPKRIKGKCGVGAVVEYQYVIMGISLPVTIEVTEDFRSEKECRWSCALSGSVTGTQRCTYRAKDKGTEADFELEYVFPESLLGRLVDRLPVDKWQENVIEETLENLKLICEDQVRTQQIGTSRKQAGIH